MTKQKPKAAVRELSPRQDMFYVESANPDYVYYHAADDPLRVRQLQLEGYEVCVGQDGEMIGSPLALQDGADSKVVNLPHHVLMRTSRENRAKLDAAKDARLRVHEQDIKDQVDSMRALLERRGLGRMRARLKDEEVEF